VRGDQAVACNVHYPYATDERAVEEVGIDELGRLGILGLDQLRDENDHRSSLPQVAEVLARSGWRCRVRW